MPVLCLYPIPAVVELQNLRLQVCGLEDHPRQISWKVAVDLPRVKTRQPIICQIFNWSEVIEWEGVRLVDVLDYFKIETDPDGYYAFYSRDGMFFETLSRDEARDPRTLLAYGMNGQPLPSVHVGGRRRKRFTYTMSVGGFAGRENGAASLVIGHIVRKKITEERVAPAVDALLNFVFVERQPGEPFRQTVTRLGAMAIERALDEKLSASSERVSRRRSSTRSKSPPAPAIRVTARYSYRRLKTAAPSGPAKATPTRSR